MKSPRASGVSKAATLRTSRAPTRNISSTRKRRRLSRTGSLCALIWFFLRSPISIGPEKTTQAEACATKVLAMPQEKRDRDGDADDRHRGANIASVCAPGIVCADISTDDCRNKHYQRLRPPDFSGNDKQDDRDAIHRPSEQCPVRIHHVDVLQTEQRPRRQHQDADGAPKISSVYRNERLNAQQSNGADVNNAREDWRQARAKREQQRRAQHQPRNHPVEGPLWRVKQKQCARKSSGQADD